QRGHDVAATGSRHTLAARRERGDPSSRRPHPCGSSDRCRRRAPLLLRWRRVLESTVRRLRRAPAAVAVAVLVLCGATMSAPTAGASSGGVWAGACVLNLAVTYSPGLTVVPGARTLNITTNSSTCVVNGTLGTINVV